MIPYLLLPFLVFLSAASCGPGEAATADPAATTGREVATVILVRHAEKEPGDDPVLTAAGTTRAEQLRDMLEEVDLAAVYATDTRRTLATAAPTATAHGLDTQPYDPAALDQLAGTLRRNYTGKTVLVVGHSNTTPQLLNALLGSDARLSIGEEDYGNLLVASVPRSGRGTLLHLHY
ncbi:histidine phosphatase family protein [Neolewinella sp.]|uniref:histidine phosphatase family protein n=1 Tax=Neolewinella sp. TaxID=2993543 RepID=UPI003B526648